MTADADAPRPYCFEYTAGASDAQRDAGFAPLASFPEFGARYVSDALFAFFSNRLLPRSRPEYDEYVRWLSVPEVPSDPLALLARSGGKRATDVFEVYPCPEPDGAGGLRLHFFLHGIQHFPPAAVERAERLSPGEALLMMHDFQNAHDRRALVLRTAEELPNDYVALGFLPRYLAAAVHTLLVALDDARGAPAGRRGTREPVARPCVVPRALPPHVGLAPQVPAFRGPRASADSGRAGGGGPGPRRTASGRSARRGARVRDEGYAAPRSVRRTTAWMVAR